MKVFVLALSICVTAVPAGAQVFDERFSDWPTETTISGRVAIGSTVSDPALLKLLLPSGRSDRKVAVVGMAHSELSPEQQKDLFEGCDLRESAGSETDQTAWIREQLKVVETLVWFSESTSRQRLPRELEPDLQEFLRGRKTLVLIGPHCIQAGSMYESVDGSKSVWRKGLNLIPDSVVQHQRDHVDPDVASIRAYLTIRPRMFGITLDGSGLLILSGRRFRMLGSGTTDFCLPKCDWLPSRHQRLAAQQQPRQNPNDYIVDLTEWRRDAIERTLERFPPKKPRTPHVKNGTLLIVGGGGMPPGLMQQFVEFAGGQDKARLVYVPCAEEQRVSPRQGIVEAWKKAGVASAAFIHTKDRDVANSDEAFLESLRNATGIWFGGGRQWNFADSYYGTEAHKLMKDVLNRGGVIGGSSAGASIQARYLARATPIQNFRIMAPGYERGGLGFISGVAIDQHFSQRNRQKDMTQLVNRYPQMLGIGIDEATALIVQKSHARVVGKGDVYFYDRSRQMAEDEPDYVMLSAGETFDLAKRKRVPAADSTSVSDSAAAN